MAKTKRILELKVVFDTSAIYSGTTSDLFKNEIRELFEKYSSTQDLKITWYLPEVVVHERTHQMRKKGLELIPSINKLERILGHNLGITPEIIELKINDTIAKHLEKNKINVLKIDPLKVNWEKLILNSCYRIAPFEDNEKEKGFRDSLVLESILQLISSSPTASSICRVIFITGDKLLQEAFINATSENANVKVFFSLEELDSLINILSSEITEKLINSIIEQAQNLFFKKENQDSFYYKENIGQKIRDKYSTELSSLPPNAQKRENGTWWIPKPGFVKKINQKIFWKTTITVDAKGYSVKKDLITSILEKYSTLPENPTGVIRTKFNTGMEQSASQTIDELIANGKTKFEVIWSITLTTTKKLINPKLEEINFIETTWE